MSTYTSSLGLELITPGSQAGLWGNTTNNSLNLIDQAVTGVTPISFASASGTTRVLTDYNGAEDEARAAVINLTGTATGSNTVVIPNKQKTYLVRNDTSQDVVFQTAVPSATYTVGAGYSILIFCDGNNNVFTGIAAPGVGTLSVNAGGTGATTFGSGGFIKSSGTTNALTATSTVNAASEVSGVLPVANGGTGASSLTSGAMLIGNGTGAVASLSGGVAGYVPTWNGSTWVSAAPSAAGVTSFSAGTTGFTPSSSTTGSITLGGTLNVSNGGTGQTSFTTNGAVYATGPTTLTSGTLPVASGGTGGTSLDGAGIVTKSGSQSITGVKTWTVADANTYGVYVSGGSQTCGLRPGGILFGPANTGFAYNSGSPSAIDCVISSAGAFSAYSDGNFKIYGSVAIKASGTTWDNPSDSRLKDNVSDYTKGLTELKQINPKTWTFNGKGGSKAGLKGVGVIADEAMHVIPDSVTTYSAKLNETDTEKTDIKKFSADEVIWMLVNSVKELSAEIEALKATK